MSSALAIVVGIPLAGAIGYVLVRYAVARFAFTLLGTVVVLGSSELNPLKIAFLFGVIVSVCVSVYQLERSASGSVLRYVRIQYVLVAALGLSALIGLVNGNEFLLIVRDAAPYGLIAAAALVASDAGRQLTERAAIAWFAAGVGLTLPAFMIEWLDRREALQGFEAPNAFLATSLVAVAFWCFALVSYVRKPRYVWLIPIAALPALILLTGSRTNFVLGAGLLILMVLLAVRRRPRDQWIRLGQVFVVAVVGGAVVLAGLLATGAIESSRITDRLETTVEAVRNPRQNDSLEARIRVNEIAWESFTEAPIIGNGLGTTFTWEARNESYTLERLTMDTTLTTLAKLGLVGTAILIAAVGSSIWVASGAGRWQDALITFLALAVLIGVFLSLFEGKGFGLAIGFLVAGAIGRRYRTESQPNEVDLRTAA